MPLSVNNRLEKATALFQEFTGHDGKHVYEYPEKHNAGKVGARIGPLDYVGVTIDGNDVFIDFRGDGQPDMGVTHDGRQLIIAGGNQPRIVAALNKKYKKGASKTVDYGTVFAVAYTTIRDGEKEAYVHQFAMPARPRLKSKMGGLIFQGGRYQFLDSGINDR